MSIKYSYVQSGGLISIETDYSDVKDLPQINLFYFDILVSSFLHKHISLLTMQPQKYSLGYELPFPVSMELDTTDFLVNDILVCDDNLLQEVSKSEEFNRGLLAVAIIENSLEDSIRFFLRSQKDVSMDNNNVKDLFAFCNSDGNYLYLFNPTLSLESLKSLER